MLHPPYLLCWSNLEVGALTTTTARAGSCGPHQLSSSHCPSAPSQPRAWLWRAGGLLSTHVLLKRAPEALVPGYTDGLLVLATDLADRLLPAFDTPSGVPLSWVNLKRVRTRLPLCFPLPRRHSAAAGCDYPGSSACAVFPGLIRIDKVSPYLLPSIALVLTNFFHSCCTLAAQMRPQYPICLEQCGLLGGA